MHLNALNWKKHGAWSMEQRAESRELRAEGLKKCLKFKMPEMPEIEKKSRADNFKK